MKTYEEVANYCGLEEITKQRFIKYMTIRWSDTESQKCQDGYAIEWANRFKDKREFECSDIFGQAILMQI